MDLPGHIAGNVSAQGTAACFDIRVSRPALPLIDQGLSTARRNHLFTGLGHVRGQLSPPFHSGQHLLRELVLRCRLLAHRVRMFFV